MAIADKYEPESGENVAQKTIRRNRYASLDNDPSVQKAWERYQKTIGKGSVSMDKKRWYDKNYPKGGSSGNVLTRYARETGSNM